MKKSTKLMSYALVTVMLFSVLMVGPRIGFFGVDAVSAATDGTTTGGTTGGTTSGTTSGGVKTSGGATTATLVIATEITRFLELNSYGGDVMLLQTMLNSNGYKLKVDGIYGPKTKTAVESYQKKNGLRVDGVIGPKTIAKLHVTTPVAQDVETPVEVVPVVEPTVEPEVDAVTTASIVDKEAAFEKAIGKDGTWIICTLNDLSFDKELVLEGDFVNTKTPPVSSRKIGLYTQDDKHVVTARFTLTAPKLTIKSPDASIQHGTFIGDLYVSAKNFKLVDATVNGNVYFTTQEAKDTFTIDNKSLITGKQIVLDVDAVTSASLVQDTAAFEKAISTEGKWIISITNNLTFNTALVLDGDFVNTKTPPASARKISLYTQDDKRVVTARFTLTAPKLTIKSPDASIQHGTFKGDLYVSAKNFKLVDATVNGNVYFTTQEAKDTFAPLDATSAITGMQILSDVDAVSSASIVRDEDAFANALSKDGTWIICILNDLTTDKDLVLEGEFRNKNLPENDLYRKIGLYTHNNPADKKIVTHRFTLTAPSLTIKSPMATLQHGIFVGDIYVETNGFSLVDNKVVGNIYFATQEALDSFIMDEASEVTGAKEVKTK